MAILDSKHEAVFTARMNVFYHEFSEQTFSRWLSWTSFISVVFSSAAFIALGDTFRIVSEHREAVIGASAMLITLLNGAVLAFGMQDRMRLHSDFRRQWIEVLQRAQTMSEGCDEELAKVRKLVADLSSIEPAPNQRRLLKSYKCTATSMGLPVES